MINLKKDLTEKEWTIIKLRAQGKTSIEMLKKLHDEYGVDVWDLE